MKLRRDKGKVRPRHFFTYDEKETVLNSTELQKYIVYVYTHSEFKDEYSGGQYVGYRKRFEKNIQDAKRAQAKRNMPFDVEAYFDDEEEILVYDSEVQAKTAEIMLEALYLKFYEPVNTVQLKTNTETVQMINVPNDYSADVIQAIDRLESPVTSYCKEK